VPPGSRSRWVAPLVLVGLVAAAYAPTWNDEFVVWDDDDHIYENRHVIAPDGYAAAWRDWRDPAFYPLTFTTWYVEWRLSGGQPWLFQLDNVLLHVTAAILLGLLLRALGLRHGLAWTIAGVWALHPQQVASVAWLTERKNVLYASFYFASLLAYARAVERDGAIGTRGWLLAVALAVAALLSKATAVTLPVAIALTHWVRGGRLDRRAGVRIGTFFALAVAVGLVHVSREQMTPLVPLGTRLLIAARVAWFYVGKFLWPTDLVAVYPRWALDGAPAWGGASLAALAAAAAAGAWWARRIPRVAWWGVGMYAINIALVVGVLWFPFMGYSFVSDHLVYVAAAGLAVVLGLAGDALLHALCAPRLLRRAVGLALWLVLATLTWRQTGMWENTEQLWTRTLAVNPQSRLAHKNLGAYLMEKGRREEARAHFRATLALAPGDAEALLDLGILASQSGDWAEATRLLEATLARGAYPSIALNNLGIVAARTGRPAQAIDHYERALEIDPGDAKVWLNLGAARVDLGDPEAALADYATALRLDPGSAAAHYDLAVALNALGRIEEAARHYEKANALAPRDADTLYNLGVARMGLEQYAEAADRFREVLAVDPGHAYAAHNLGVVLLSLGRLDAAEEAFEHAHALAPNDADTAAILARLRSRHGGRRDAAGWHPTRGVR